MACMNKLEEIGRFGFAQSAFGINKNGLAQGTILV